MHHSSNPDYIIIHDLLRDGDPGDVTLAAEVHVATEVVFDVLHPLGEDRFSVRHQLLCDRRSLLLTIIVSCVHTISVSMVSAYGIVLLICVIQYL